MSKTASYCPSCVEDSVTSLKSGGGSVSYNAQSFTNYSALLSVRRGGVATAFRIMRRHLRNIQGYCPSNKAGWQQDISLHLWGKKSLKVKVQSCSMMIKTSSMLRSTSLRRKAEVFHQIWSTQQRIWRKRHRNAESVNPDFAYVYVKTSSKLRSIKLLSEVTG